MSAGHIHNYERNVVEGVTYLVSGGGGAPPYFVERSPQDLYKEHSVSQPYHYVKLTVEKDRHRTQLCTALRNPEAENLAVEAQRQFRSCSERR